MGNNVVGIDTIESIIREGQLFHIADYCTKIRTLFFLPLLKIIYAVFRQVAGGNLKALFMEENAVPA